MAQTLPPCDHDLNKTEFALHDDAFTQITDFLTNWVH